MDRIALLEELNHLDDFESMAMTRLNFNAKELIENLDAAEIWYENGDNVILLASQLMELHEKISWRKHPRFISKFEHKHDFLELTYALKGSATQVINGERVIMQQGDITLLDTNIMHAIEPINMDSIIINILMKEDYFNDHLLMRLSENQVISEFITSAIYRKSLQGRHLSFSLGDNEKIRNYMESVLWELMHPQLGSQESVNCHMILLFTELMRSIQFESSLKDGNKNQSKKTPESVFTMIQYINDHYMEQGLEETAQYFHVHPKYLTRLLKRYIGKSYIEMIQDLRMEKAVTLLRNSPMTIHEVAHESGYTNVNQFYKQFKKSFNQTPKEFRKG